MKKHDRKAKGDNYQNYTYAVIIILLMLFIAAGHFPIRHLWGFNHLIFFPENLVYILAPILLILLLPSVGDDIYKNLSRFSRAIRRHDRIIQLILIGVFSLIIFYFFRSQVHSLGDGYQRVYQIEKGYLYNPPEPLDFFLHAAAYHALNIVASISAETIYSGFSIICGIIFVMIIYRFKFPESINSRSAGLAKLMIISAGSMQLFFGYVESYTIVNMSSLLYVLWAFRYLIDGRGLIMTSVFFGISIALHQSGTVLLPSFILLIYFSLKSPRNEHSGHKIWPIIIGIIPILTMIGLEIREWIIYPEYKKGIGELLLPLYAGGDYSILSFIHLFDIINEFLLIIPGLIVLIPLIIYSGIGSKVSSRLKLTAGTIILFSLLFIIALDPKLGYARDWDLFAMPMALIGAVVIMTLAVSGIFDKLRGNLKFGIVFIPLFFASIWILTNASASRQLARAEHLLVISERGSGYSTELLAHYYWQIANDKEKALQLMRTIKMESRSARVYNKITQLEYSLKHYDKAFESAVKGLEYDSLYTDLYLLAGASLNRLGYYEIGLKYLITAQKLEPNRSNIYSYLATVYLKLDSMQQALKAARTAVRLDPKDAAGYFNIGYTFIESGQLDSAQIYINTGLKLNPNYPKAGAYLELLNKAKQNITAPAPGSDG